MPMKIYLNNAATSYPKPKCVAKAVSEAISNLPGAMHRGGFADFDVFDAVRRELCPILGVADPENIALGSNATWALNLAIFGMGLSAGDRVVTTKAEHNSVLRPLHALEQTGVQVRYLNVDPLGRMNPDLWQKAMEEDRPQLAIFTHASNVTGAVNDAADLIASAKAVSAAVLMDASQSLGCVPVWAEEWGADMVAFTGHKYLLGPQGTGGLWVRPGVALQPHLVGGTGIHSDMDTMPPDMPLHLEAGTGNEPSYHGLLAALRWTKENPMDDKIFRRLDRLTEGLKNLGCQVIDPGYPRTPVVSFRVPGQSVSETGFLLEESCDIICRTGLHCAPKIFGCLGMPQTLRFSLSRFTSDGEIDEVLKAVEDVIS